MARSHGFVRSRRSDRQNIWVGVNLEDQTVTASSSLLTGSLNAAALASRPFTIIRTHLEVNWRSDQAAVDEAPMGCLGAMVITSSASAAGIASIPTPVTESDADWYVYQPLINAFKFLSSVGFQSDAGSVYTVDSKAMRKVGPDQDVAFVTEESNAFGGIISIMGRFLIKLH